MPLFAIPESQYQKVKNPTDPNILREKAAVTPIHDQSQVAPIDTSS